MTINLRGKKTHTHTQCESCELSFIWGFTEDYRPGVSLSDSSEELCQRGEGAQYLCENHQSQLTRSLLMEFQFSRPHLMESDILDQNLKC